MALPQDDAHLRETRIAQQELLRGHFLHVVRDEVALPSGHTATREYVLHPGAVMIIGLLDDGRVVMERLYRHPMGEVLLEMPAGKLDKGEGSLACARRELQEETGYVAKEWAFACQLAPTVAYSDERIDVWFARGLAEGDRHLDEGEFLDVIAMAPQELLAACRDGRIIDSKTLVGALWLQNVLSGAWPLDWSGRMPAGISR